MMKYYKVEFKEQYTEDFDNWIGDYVPAESEDEAEVLGKAWLEEHGYEGDVDGLFVQVTEVEYRHLTDEQFMNVLDGAAWYEDEMVKELCRRTNLLKEYNDADAYGFEDVLEKAYVKLYRKVNK